MLTTTTNETVHRDFAFFSEQLDTLRHALERRDSSGVNFALRVGIAQALFLSHDRLRSEERPFDRATFAAQLEDAAISVERSPSIKPGDRGETATRPVYEEYVADLYSRCWAKYDDRAFLETVDFFEERFRLNDAPFELEGCGCLDAGCGSGRYTVAMAKHGARQAVGVDLSLRAVTEARQRAQRLGFGPRVEFLQKSVIDLPAEWSAQFDFVCSNGVVHHTPDPRKGLEEIRRVLKPGGTAFIMVYGKGGLFWALVDFIREILAPVPLDFADAWLQLAGVPVGKIFFCLDHWYTMYQERIDQGEFERRLTDVGFSDIRYLPRARIYDSSERLHRYPTKPI